MALDRRQKLVYVLILTRCRFGWFNNSFRSFSTELWPLIDLEIPFMLNILWINWWILIKFCKCIGIDKIKVRTITIFFFFINFSTELWSLIDVKIMFHVRTYLVRLNWLSTEFCPLIDVKIICQSTEFCRLIDVKIMLQPNVWKQMRIATTWPVIICLSSIYRVKAMESCSLFHEIWKNYTPIWHFMPKHMRQQKVQWRCIM